MRDFPLLRSNRAIVSFFNYYDYCWKLVARNFDKYESRICTANVHEYLKHLSKRLKVSVLFRVQFAIRRHVYFGRDDRKILILHRGITLTA